jgi:MazG-like family
VDIRLGQKLAWENKTSKGFNTTDVPLEFCLLQGEVAEAFDAWRRGRDSVGEELADVAIYLLGLAEMTGFDLQDEIETKIAKNSARSYHQLANGTLVKSEGDATD